MKMGYMYFRLIREEWNYQEREKFLDMGPPDKNRYTLEQKIYALKKIVKHGVRGTSRILHIPRRTLQRWVKQYYHKVKRCPDWVYDWAYLRRYHNALRSGRHY